MTSQPIRVGLIGAAPDRGWAASAHIPALRALPDYALAAVCTTRQESADATARNDDHGGNLRGRMQAFGAFAQVFAARWASIAHRTAQLFKR